jgi:hypothetical protein
MELLHIGQQEEGEEKKKKKECDISETEVLFSNVSCLLRKVE